MTEFDNEDWARMFCWAPLSCMGAVDSQTPNSWLRDVAAAQNPSAKYINK